MKLKNILFVFLTIFILMFLCTKVEAARDSITAEGSNDYLEGSDYLPGDSSIRISIKRESGLSSYNIYCVNSEKVWFNTGTRTFNYVGEMNSKIAYILANGYPTKSITTDYRKDYFITSMAIYYVLNDSIAQGFTLDLENYANSTYWARSSTVAEEMAKLVAGANNYSESSGSISASTSDNKLTLSNDEMYYVSKQISVNTTGNVGNYTVSLSGAPSDTIVTDVNGNVKNTFAKNEKFLVKVPVSSVTGLSISVNVNISTNETKYKAYEYTYNGDNIQNIVIGEMATTPLSTSLSLSGTVTTRVEISKVDATTGEELPGATLVLKDSNGKVIDEWVSEDTPHKVKVKLSAGKYTLTETIAPEGYELSTETVEFTVEEDGSVKEPVVMKNEKEIEPVPTGDFLIYIAWIIGMAAIGYSVYYFNSLRKGKLEN